MLHAITSLALIVSLTATERVDITNGSLAAPGQNRCVRLHASGDFSNARVRVNSVAAGELRDQNAELDITGYLSTGAANSIEVHAARGVIARVWVWLSPPVYIVSAKLVSKQLEITITNTTENTAQVEIGEHQFTVSPGTSATKHLTWPGGPHIKMRAVSDGLDREFVDEADAIEPR